MAVTLHALEDENEYTRLRFCACCPLTPGGDVRHTGTKARLRRVLSHVGAEEDWAGGAPRELGAGGDLPGGVGRLLRTEGATMDIPWCRDVTPEPQAAAAAAALRAAPAAASSSSNPGIAAATQRVDQLAADLEGLSMDIWRNPELNYRETYACAAITAFLEARGVAVEGNYCGLPTALRAEVSNGDGPVIAFCAEYDALPEIGHACGHNLIAMAAVGGFLGAKAALEQGLVTGTAVLIGTPAEEAGGGKVDLIEAGAFDAVDCAMMTHPTTADLLYPSVLAIQEVVVKYHGVNAHAAGNPEDGVNALDAVIAAFNAIAAMRQQMKSTWRVHGIILKGGLKPNIIPNFTSTEWYARAPSATELEVLKAKLNGCFEGAALQTGCTCDIEWNHQAHPFFNLQTNSIMAERYREHMGERGVTFRPRVVEEQLTGGSTDMGNVSWIVPSIQPMFKIPTPVGNHHPDFTATTGIPASHVAALHTAEAMAATAVRVSDPPPPPRLSVAVVHRDWGPLL
jgi:amidohydrolase